MKEVPKYEASAIKIVRTFKKSSDFLCEEAYKQVGDIAQITAFNHTLYSVINPEWIKQIFYEKRAKYLKGVSELELVLRYGLITNNNYEEWKVDRTILNSLFTEEKLKRYANIMVNNCAQMLESWKDIAKQNTAINIDKTMTRLVFKNLLATFFNNVNIDLDRFTYAVRKTMLTLYARGISLFKLKWKLPTPAHFEFYNQLKELREFGNAVVKFCLETRDNNCIKLLYEAYSKVPEITQEKIQLRLRDEALTFLVAGHETTASTLSRIWIILSQYPLLVEKLREEIKTVLNGRNPTFEDLASLPYAHAVILETLRLYPPITTLVRYLIEDDEINGYSLKKGSHIITPLLLLHRQAAYWENPAGFIPERFLSKLDDKYNFIYMPFGAGPRLCIGKNFAIMEAVLIMVMILQKYNLELVPKIIMEDSGALITRPDPTIEMWVKEIRKD